MNIDKDRKINLGSLNKNQIEFYNFATKNINIFLEKPIPEIAKLYGVGVSFVYTFFKKLGFNNSREFIFYLGFNNGEEFIQKMNNQNVDINPNYALHKITKESNIVNRLLLEKQFDKITDLINQITKANNIYGLGFGYSKLAIKDISGLFTKLNITFNLVNNERYEDATRIKEITKGDIVIVYSLRGIDKNVINWTKRIKKLTENQVKIFLITSNTKSQLIKIVDSYIEIDNIMKRIDILDKDLLLSPLNSFIFFNNYIKTLLYIMNKEKYKTIKDFREEMHSWIYEKN